MHNWVEKRESSPVPDPSDVEKINYQEGSTRKIATKKLSYFTAWGLKVSNQHFNTESLSQNIISSTT